MALGVLVAILKPFVILWAALNAIDDLALVMRLARLGAVLVPGVGGRGADRPSDLCDVCDDVMGDLLRAEGLSAVPCGMACLRLPACVRMCQRVKEASATATEFPCVAAGYCDAGGGDGEDVVVASEGGGDPECRSGPLFSCEPRHYCRRTRRRLRFSCELRPGIGRWVGMKRSAASHAAAVAEGLLSQRHCGEEGAGPYCIARPAGVGAVAEAVGHVLSLAYGGYRSVAAIESPGGDDDQQWLTFWVILTAVLFVERFLARALLSTFPLYYEAKLVVLVWLLWRGGAETIYRKLRRALLKLRLLKSQEQAAAEELEILRAASQDLVESGLALVRDAAPKAKAEPDAGDWQEDGSSERPPDAVEELHRVSKFLLSAEGAEAMERCCVAPDVRADLMERAAAVVSFQPRFVLVGLLGALDEPRGELPPMDSDGRADAYVTCRLVAEDGLGGAPYPEWGVRSRIAWGTLRPRWDETLELQLRGGAVCPSGNYRNNTARFTKLHVVVRDADVGRWGFALRFFRLAVVGLMGAAVAAYVAGVTDDLSEGRRSAALAVADVAGAGFILSYIMAVLRRADDELIGECVVPLAMLLDQSERTLLLKLREPREAKSEAGVDEPMPPNVTRRTNSVGGLGIIRIKLWLSEN